jgi:hypothetical protein
MKTMKKLVWLAAVTGLGCSTGKLRKGETEMLKTQTVPQGKDMANQGELYISLELGDRSWKLTTGMDPN